MKKKVTILFNGAHLAYSPTVIGLYDLLSEKFDVVIVADDPNEFGNQPLTSRNVVYKPKAARRNSGIFDKLKQKKPVEKAGDFLRSNRHHFGFGASADAELLALEKMGFEANVIRDFEFVRKFLCTNETDFIIAVDFRNLLFAQILGKSVELVSLEIPANDKFYKNCDFKNINSVVIQTRERFEYLFGKRELKTFFVQNAPSYVEFPEAAARQNLVYCGTAWNAFGIYHCLNFLREFPEYTMNVKGAIFEKDRRKIEAEYKDLLAGKRLIIDDEYLDDAAAVDYLRQFKAGFCFYNFDLKWVDNFNYHSAPSGKMFKYMAAGVPVIGQEISGLKPVKEFDCGVLIKDLKPSSIKKAVEKIEENFGYYSANCLQAAAHYSFDKRAKPFVDYLDGK